MRSKLHRTLIFNVVYEIIIVLVFYTPDKWLHKNAETCCNKLYMRCQKALLTLAVLNLHLVTKYILTYVKFPSEFSLNPGITQEYIVINSRGMFTISTYGFRLI